ncbi:hypothetical protein Tcan_05590 [Toxocara canis]|uniref:Uncharacterized protein n=1 Tax=Toxocara canis TaxID=6265 RepID=A0A0B2VC86_TOXCA|nr:hypothetical protein Tcan_05590 [Toxocara canis]
MKSYLIQLYISQSFLNAKYIVKPAELIPNVYTEQFRVMGRFMTSSSEYTLCWDSQWRPYCTAETRFEGKAFASAVILRTADQPQQFLSGIDFVRRIFGSF